MRAAADVLRGRQVKPGFALNVVPTSNELMAAAAKEGLIGTLVEAGAFISSPSCDYCFGRIATMTANQRAVSTETLNVKGRMGSPDSRSTCATPPRSRPRRSKARSRIRAGTCDMSNALPNLKGRVAFVFEERDFDVDQIIGVKNIKNQDVAELAALAMQSYDPEFQQKVRPGDVVVGADNFGYGHPHYPPMRAMRHLGITGGSPKASRPATGAARSAWASRK